MFIIITSSHLWVDQLNSGNSLCSLLDLQITAITPQGTHITSSCRTTHSGKETTKPCNADILPDMFSLWNTTMPLCCELIGTLDPWKSLDLKQVQSIFQHTCQATWSKRVTSSGTWWVFKLILINNVSVLNLLIVSYGHWIAQSLIYGLAFINQVRGYECCCADNHWQFSHHLYTQWH